MSAAPRLSHTLSDLARVTNGRLVGADVAFASVSIDSRTLPQGALFVALKGPSFDGHEFVETAAHGGAIGALVQQELNADIPQVVVGDTLQALTDFARAWRREFAVPVVGITGSNGKTTTKEMIGSILSRAHNCLVTQGNLNNHIGVPLTLMGMNAEHGAAVIEMGANHQGEIAALAAIAEPTVGIITNAGAAHLEGFGGLNGVAHGKGELFRALGPAGTAVINADDAFADFWRETSSAGTVLTFGLAQPADFWARSVRSQASAAHLGFEFELMTPAGSKNAQLGLAGIHNLRNALGAAAAAYAAGATLNQIVEGLANMRAVSGRLQLLPAINDSFLLDDSYNANPSSLRAGLDALQAMPTTPGDEHWLVLGDMLELGASGDELHAEMGAYARTAGVRRMFAVGPRARFACDAYGAGASWFPDLDALIDALRTELKPHVTVLIKGSRANRLERVAAALALNPDSAASGH
jgi:UDP-N-acetylmuramoyl-tripeptide--D-alanyl-D-alanine ligase